MNLLSFGSSMEKVGSGYYGLWIQEVELQPGYSYQAVGSVKLTPAQLQAAKIIFDTAVAAGVPKNKAPFIVAQSAFETSSWTSNVFRQDNNGFGMRMPSRRKSPFIAGPGRRPPAAEGATPYAHYRTLSDSVKDLLHWFNYVGGNWNNFTSPEQYATWLKSKGYFMGSLQTYSARVRDLVQQLSDYFKAGGFGPIIAAILIYFLIR